MTEILPEGSGIHGGDLQAGGLIQAEDDVHVLDGLTGGALTDVVDDRTDQQALGAGVVGGRHAAQVGAGGPLGLDGLAGGEHADKVLVLVVALIDLVQLVVGDVLVQGGIDGDLNTADLGYDLSKYIIMGQGTYNNYRLTGQRVITPCLASGSGLLNTWTKSFDPELMAELGIREEQLSRLVAYDQTFPLTEEAAQALGVQAGVPVIPTNSDGGLNQVGTGAVADGVMTFSVGTSGAIRLTTSKPVLPKEPSTWCYMSPKNWMSGAATNGCCNCLDWFKEQVGMSRLSYGELERGISDWENNPVFLPFLFGERCPGWNDEREGGFVRILPRHKLPDLYLAVQEGILFNLYHCYRILSEVNGCPTHIRFSGGILHSEQWTQMCADIFQRELEVNRNEHGSLLGGAVLAMELLGVIDDACTYQPEVSRIIRPDPARAEFYQRKFQRYLECYNKGN